MGPPVTNSIIAQTNSRIGYADLNVSGWVAECDADVTDWDKADEFVLSTYGLSDSVNPDSDFKFQWRRQGRLDAPSTKVALGMDDLRNGGRRLIDGGREGFLWMPVRG